MVKRRALLTVMGMIVLLFGAVPESGELNRPRRRSPLRTSNSWPRSARSIKRQPVKYGVLLLAGRNAAGDRRARWGDPVLGCAERSRIPDVGRARPGYLRAGVQPDGGHAGIGGMGRQRATVGYVDVGTGRGFSRAPRAGLQRLVSPFLQWMASAGGYQDNTVRMWNTEKLRALSVLRNHYDWVTGVAYSPDGRRLASSSADGSLRVWNLITDTGVMVMSGHTGPIGSVAWSPDSTTIATGSLDGTIRLWDAVSGETRRVIETGYVWQVVFSPDGSLLAAGGRDGEVMFWNAQTGEPLVTFQAHPRWVNALAFNGDGTMLATAATRESSSCGVYRIVSRHHAQPPAKTPQTRILKTLRCVFTCTIRAQPISPSGRAVTWELILLSSRV